MGVSPDCRTAVEDAVGIVMGEWAAVHQGGIIRESVVSLVVCSGIEQCDRGVLCGVFAMAGAFIYGPWWSMTGAYAP